MQILKLRYLKYLCTILFLLFTLKAAAPNLRFAYIITAEPVNAYERLINAVVQVESGGDTLAYNLIEEARGAFQIRPIRLQDYNLRTGKEYKIEDCYNYNISKEIFLYYANIIGIPHYETIARNWNGSGEATLDYWEKVKFYF
jgi:hypothetical protein